MFPHCRMAPPNHRNTGLSSIDVLAALHNVPSTRGRVKLRTNSQYQTLYQYSRQTAREIDNQPSITWDPDSDAPTAQPSSDVDQGASQVNHTMDNSVIEYLGTAVEPAGSAIALVSWL